MIAARQTGAAAPAARPRATPPPNGTGLPAATPIGQPLRSRPAQAHSHDLHAGLSTAVPCQRSWLPRWTSTASSPGAHPPPGTPSQDPLAGASTPRRYTSLDVRTSIRPTTHPFVCQKGHQDRMEKVLLTPEEAAEVLGISRSKLYELLQGDDPEIKSVKIGKARRIPAKEVHAYVAALLGEAS